LSEHLVYIKVHGDEYVVEGWLEGFRCRHCRTWTKIVDTGTNEERAA
jgi:hypothetical protein